MSIDSELVLLRMGFEEGLFGRDDVRAWVDRESALLDQLPAALLELATLTHKPDHEIATLLRALEPDVPPAVQAKAGVAVLGALYANGRVSLRDAVSRLCRMAEQGSPKGSSPGDRGLDPGTGTTTLGCLLEGGAVMRALGVSPLAARPAHGEADLKGAPAARRGALPLTERPRGDRK